MIGKLIITNINLSKTYDEDAGKEYIEDLIIGDILHIGHKWHKLSSVDTLANRLKTRYGV